MVIYIRSILYSYRLCQLTVIQREERLNFFFEKGSTFSSVSSDWSVQLVHFFYERKALDLDNVLHTHIDDIGCPETFLETPQLKIPFQNHHFYTFWRFLRLQNRVAKEYGSSKIAMFARLVA